MRQPTAVLACPAGVAPARRAASIAEAEAAAAMGNASTTGSAWDLEQANKTRRGRPGRIGQAHARRSVRGYVKRWRINWPVLLAFLIILVIVVLAVVLVAHTGHGGGPAPAY